MIGLLNPTLTPESKVEFDEVVFVLSSDALQEIMSRSALSDGAGSKTLTEPFLLWCDHFGRKIIEETVSGMSFSLPDITGLSYQ